MPYIELPLTSDVDSLTQTGIDYMDIIYGANWIPRPGNPDTVLIEGAGQIAGELVDQAAIVPPEALEAIGTSIYGVPKLLGSKASGSATITFAPDTPATMVPIEAEISVPHPSGSKFIFTTDRDAIAPAGGGNVAVLVYALDVGFDQNGSFGESELIEIYEGVTMVYVNGTSGGTDPETSEEYLDRLTAYLTMPRRPVRPEDHANLALQVAGVGRATAYNLYYPGTTARDAGLAIGDYDKYTPQPAPAAAATNVPRCTTVAITGLDGADPSDALMQEVYETLDYNREVNFLNFVMRPVYTPVDVKAQIKPWPDQTAENALSAAIAMMNFWLSPANWSGGAGGSGALWAIDPKVRVNEAIDYLNRAAPVWYVENVQLKLGTDAGWTSGDINLPGAIGIPIPVDENFPNITVI
jgi:hypothetical protein